MRTSRPKLRLQRVGKGIDFLSANVSLEIDDQSISLAAALEHFRKQAYIPLNDGSRAVINPEYLRKLERLFRRGRGEEVRLSFFDLPLLDELIEENERQRLDGLAECQAIRAALTATRSFPLPELGVALRPYQESGYHWLRRLHAAGLGACLADDMGLGKTVQALAVLRATVEADTPPSLIVMPRSLLFNWQAAIARFVPGLTCAVYHGPGRDLETARRSHLVLTTYGTVRTDIEATANGHKCLVFASFLGALETLGEDLTAAGIEPLVMTGATRDRETLVRRFQTDDSVRVFLLTLKTGGVGLNLTAADYVFIYDPWWNRAAETQAVDRTHRIGQKNTVFTYRLVTRNTIEEKILRLQEQKGAIFDSLVGADAATLRSLTVEDVRFALGVNGWPS